MYRNSLQKLIVAQNCILKIIFKKQKRYHTSLLYTEDICNIRTLFFHSLCMYAFGNKFLGSCVPSNHQTCGAVDGLLLTQRFKKSICHRFFVHTLPKACNLLPREIRLITQHRSSSVEARRFIFQNFTNFIKILE